MRFIFPARLELMLKAQELQRPRHLTSQHEIVAFLSV